MVALTPSLCLLPAATAGAPLGLRDTGGQARMVTVSAVSAGLSPAAGQDPPEGAECDKETQRADNGHEHRAAVLSRDTGASPVQGQALA